MLKGNHKKIIIASALVAGAAVSGVALVSSHMASAATSENMQTEIGDGAQMEMGEGMPPEMGEGMPPEMSGEMPSEMGEGMLPEMNEDERPGKPADLTDEEWEQKKAELKEMLDAMTDEERTEWLENHKPMGANPPELGEMPELPSAE